VPDREFDVVLFGATGFTGGLTADYLAGAVPDGCRWALAGRNQGKLAAVRDRLTATHPELAELPLLHADATDPASLADVAGRARVVISTVGPYVEHGEPLVAACVEAGTDYVDLTGEPEFVDTVYVKHHRRAVETGARIVHACGFDSIPHDLGALFTVQQLPEGVPLRVRGMVRSNATLSGGTFASALGAFSRARQMKQAHAERRKVEPRVEGRKVRTAAKRPHHDAESGYWLVPLPTIDPFVVRRSAAALERYGPDFTYSHYAAAKKLPSVVGGIGLVGGLAAAAQVPPLRRFLLGRLPQGQGPSEERRARSYFSVRFIGEGGGRTVFTEVRGGDPGYTETAKMLAESALCLAFDENPTTAGQVTTAVAMGQNLLDRLVKAGLEFTILRTVEA
jgi:short subunit dehydrogenase-like uncharacterized protein